MYGVYISDKNIQNLGEETTADLDSKQKISKEWSKETHQEYIGEVFHGNIHGHGFFSVENGCKLFYDGHFYANKLEGYAQVFYDNGANYQGLFKNNVRFGPGIYTYSNGEQDVGLWNENRLVRLGSLNKRNLVPRLASTAVGQLKLLKYRYLVPVCFETKDIAYTILQNLGASKQILEHSHKLYNLEVDNKRNIFFDEKRFNEQFYDNQDCSINIIMTEDDADLVMDSDTGKYQPPPSLKIHKQRVNQIQEILKIIKDKLEDTKKKRTGIQRKVEHCRLCCQYQYVQTSIEEEGTANESAGHDANRGTNNEDTHSHKSEDNCSDDPLFVLPNIIPSNYFEEIFEVRDSVLFADSDVDTDALFDDSAAAQCAREYVDQLSVTHSQTADSQKADPLDEIKDYLTNVCSCDEIMYINDIKKLERSLSIVTQDELFYEAIIKNLSDKLDKHQKKCQNATNVKTKKITVKSVLAWNNEKFCMRMLKHSFLHRYSEYMVNFDVSDLIAGNRNKFGSPGVHERHCTEFLASCSWGDKQALYDQVKEQDLNINVSDAKGNNGIFFAVVNGHKDLIKILVDLGAKVDHENDEGLLPLSIGLLMYLAEKNKIENEWEKYFLPEDEPKIEREEAFKWYPNLSLLNILEEKSKILENEIDILDKKSDVMEKQSNIVEKNSVLSSKKSELSEKKSVTIGRKSEARERKSVAVERRYTIKEKKSETLSKRGTLSSKSSCTIPIEATPYIFDTSYINDINVMNISSYRDILKPSSSTRSRQAELQVVEDCITMLLQCGANPNAGGSPLPPLIISLFTEKPSIVEKILEAHADINITTDEEMTSLHIISSLKCCQENVDICHLLVTHGCDPRLKTSVTHWPEQKMEILGKDVKPEDIEDTGKNPLHILSIRRDFQLDTCSFFQQMTLIFINSDIDYNERYLGHTPLSLAVLYGNMKLVEALMNRKVIDPHQNLDYNMGNVLTVYTLKKYEYLIPPNAFNILDILVKLGVNPLQCVGEYENCIAFLENEHKEEVRRVSKEMSSKPHKKMNNVENISEIQQIDIIKHLLELSRKTITKCIQLQAVENMYNLIEDDLGEHECMRFLAEFLTPEIVIANLQRLFQYGKIHPDRFNRDVCLQIIDFVDTYQRIKRFKREFSESSLIDSGRDTRKQMQKPTKNRQDLKKHVFTTTDYTLLLDVTDFKKLDNFCTKFKLLPPGLDNSSKYKVCFHCFKKRNKLLLVCPRCQMVYFCSDICNKQNLKIHTMHTCNKDFYNSRKKYLQSTSSVDLDSYAKLYIKARQNCENRRLKKIEEKLEMEKKQLCEELKSDIYGTKLLRRLREARAYRGKTPTVVSLVGSTCTNDRFARDYGNTNKMKETYSKNLSSQKSREFSSKLSFKGSAIVLPTKPEGKKEAKVCRMDSHCSCKECKSINRQFRRDSCECFIKENIEKTAKKIKVNGKDIATDQNVHLQKLRQIPNSYKRFIEKLTGSFPEVDFSSLLLPYACYSNGNFYYRFLDRDAHTKT